MAPKLTKPLSAKDVVFTAKPLIHRIAKEFKNKFCDYCLKSVNESNDCSENPTIIECEDCHQMSYCSDKCKDDDIKYHTNECQLFGHKKFDFRKHSKEFLLSLRLYLCIDKKTIDITGHQLFDGTVVSLYDKDILNDIKIRSVQSDKDFVTSWNCIKDLSPIDLNSLRHWFGFITQLNLTQDLMAVESDVEDDKPVGIGLYIQFLSLRRSHSCIPNCAFITKGLSIELRAMKSIPIGAKLTISFIDLTQDKTKRKDLLKKYSFDCKCPKCEENTDSAIDYNVFKTFETLYFQHKKDTKDLKELLTDIENLLKGDYKTLDVVFGEYNPAKTHMLAMIASFLFDLPDLWTSEEPMVLDFWKSKKHLVMLNKLIPTLFKGLNVTHVDSHPIHKRVEKLKTLL